MSDLIATHDIFNPFGDAVKIGCTGVAGDSEIAANLFDLCQHYSVDYDQAKKIHFPDGSVLMLQVERESLATELYLSEDAYPVFMRWVSEVQL